MRDSFFIFLIFHIRTRAWWLSDNFELISVKSRLKKFSIYIKAYNKSENFYI